MFKKALFIFFTLGIILTITGFILSKGDFSKISEAFNRDSDYTFVTKTGNNHFEVIDIELESANIILKTHDEDGFKIDYYESDYDKKTIEIEDNKIEIEQELNEWQNLFAFKYTSIKIQNINFYVPKEFNGIINIETISGNVEINDFNIKQLNVNVTSGRIKLKDINIEGNTNLKTNSGNIRIENISTQFLNAHVTSGQINLVNANIEFKTTLKTTSGNILIEILNSDQIEANSGSGRVEMISILSNYLSINVKSGGIKVVMDAPESDFSIHAKSESSSVYLQGNKIGNTLDTNHGTNHINLRSTSGSIRLSFNK